MMPYFEWIIPKQAKDLFVADIVMQLTSLMKVVNSQR